MLIVLSCATLLVTVCIGIHYRSLVAIAQWPRAGMMDHQRWIAVLVLGALATHLIEIFVFAIGYLVLDQIHGSGGLRDLNGAVSSDYCYFSFVAYTSLGFGDIVPVGPIRYLAAVETLTGLILIAWTASLVFVEMQNSWQRD